MVRMGKKRARPCLGGWRSRPLRVEVQGQADFPLLLRRVNAISCCRMGLKDPWFTIARKVWVAKTRKASVITGPSSAAGQTHITATTTTRPPWAFTGQRALRGGHLRGLSQLRPIWTKRRSSHLVFQRFPCLLNLLLLLLAVMGAGLFPPVSPLPLSHHQ